MKKYLYLLFAAIFATMSLTFVACGDDDDEPSGSSFQTLTINGKNFYNCIGGAMYVASTYDIDEGYVWENGQYVPMEKVDFTINLYDQKTIEADGFATIELTIPYSAFVNGKDITSDIIDFSIDVRSDESWELDEDDKNHSVTNGKLTLEVKKDKATLNFSKFAIKLEGQTVTIDGKVTCEE